MAAVAAVPVPAPRGGAAVLAALVAFARTHQTGLRRAFWLSLLLKFLYDRRYVCVLLLRPTRPGPCLTFPLLGSPRAGPRRRPARMTLRPWLQLVVGAGASAVGAVAAAAAPASRSTRSSLTA
jgi:hypothetical protein